MASPQVEAITSKIETDSARLPSLSIGEKVDLYVRF
jgi:hypothetical protein